MGHVVRVVDRSHFIPPWLSFLIILTKIVAKPQIVYNRGMCTTVKRAMFCTRNGEKHIENLDQVCVLIGRLKGLTESEYLDLCAINKLENARALEMAKHYPSH